MSIQALVISYLLGGVTFIPLVILAALYFTFYTSVPVGDTDPHKQLRGQLEQREPNDKLDTTESLEKQSTDVDDIPRIRKGWLTVRRTFEESSSDGSYVHLMRSFLDARSKDPKKSRPKDMWYVALKGKVLFLYEDESMTDCEGAIELGSHDVFIYPEQLPDGELYAKRNAICFKPKSLGKGAALPSVTKEMKLESDVGADDAIEDTKKSIKEKQAQKEIERQQSAAREEAHNVNTPWFIFVRSNIEMEDWYLAFVHASDNSPLQPTLEPLRDVFHYTDMEHLVQTLDEQPDVIPMRWLNAIIGRVFFSYYRTHVLEQNIIARLMKKITKVKFPAFLTDVLVTEVSLGNRPPMLSKPMLKELTKEGDASMEVHLAYKGEIRITIQATATINLGARFKPYTVKLALAAVLKELEGNLLIKVKPPPSSRIWYAFTQMPRMVLAVEPIVSERQITWAMILSTIESKLKEIILESVVLPNMDDISFFDSDSYHHRGGIWSDAKRTDRMATSFPDTPSATVSAPAKIEIQESPEEPTVPAVAESQPSTNPEQDAQSAPAEIEATDTNSSEPEPKPEALLTKTRRKSWFSTSDETTDKLDADIPKRKRLSDIFAPSTPPRVSSTSGRPEGSLSDGESTTTDGSRPGTPKNSILFPGSPGAQFNNGKKPSTLFSPTSPTQPGTPSTTSSTTLNTSSFLANLKTRADAQALENTAKEAMRKWGVNLNWGGKKDAKGEDEGVSDQGSVGPSKAMDKLQVAGEKARSSYADVRAAVAERKERSEGHSQPMTIPEHKRRGSSASQSHLTAPKMEGSTSSSSRSDVGSSSKSEGGSSYTEESGIGLEEEPKKPRIAVQPQAKTMSIPGIHAAHRGEVQSLGHVAAAPDPPATKNKTIQSVYRLLSRPQATTPSTTTTTTTASATIPSPPGSFVDATPTAAASTPESGDLSSETMPTPPSPGTNTAGPSNLTEPGPRPKPPPLPPRNSVAAVAGNGVIGSPTNVPTASDSLKTIVEKARSVSTTAPPLPPRPSPPVEG